MRRRARRRSRPCCAACARRASPAWRRPSPCRSRCSTARRSARATTTRARSPAGPRGAPREAMAKVPLIPIGRPRAEFLDAESFERQRAAMKGLSDELDLRRAKIAAGWGASYVERVHAKGKWTARERLERLKDPHTSTHEVGTFVNFERRFGKLESPAAGVITAFARVHGKWT